MMPKLLTVLLVVLELFLAAGALYGGTHLVMDPTGASLQMPADQFLGGTPFTTFLVPGLLLLVVNGLFPLAVVGATCLRARWATFGHLAVGAVLLGWMGVQIVLLGFGASIQALYLGLGGVIALLATVRWMFELPPETGPKRAA